MHDVGDDPILRIVEKCGKKLSQWNRNVFGNVRKDLEKKKGLLIKAEREALINGSNCKIRELKAEINILLDREARL